MHKRRKRERCMMALTEKIQHSNRVYFSKPKTLLFTVFPLTFDFYFRNLRKEGRRRRGGRYHIRKGKIIGARGTKGIVRSQCIVRCRISTARERMKPPLLGGPLLGGIQTTHNIERRRQKCGRKGERWALPFLSIYDPPFPFTSEEETTGQPGGGGGEGARQFLTLRIGAKRQEWRREAACGTIIHRYPPLLPSARKTKGRMGKKEVSQLSFPPLLLPSVVVVVAVAARSRSLFSLCENVCQSVRDPFQSSDPPRLLFLFPRLFRRMPPRQGGLQDRRRENTFLPTRRRGKYFIFGFRHFLTHAPPI